MSDNQPETFDIRNFAMVMREITFYRTRQLGRPDDAQSFFQAQTDVVVLRNKLERAYNSAVEKAKRKKGVPPELWMMGLVAYHLIVEGGESILDVSKLSGNKLVKRALELAKPLEETALARYIHWKESGEPEDDATFWEEIYMFEKKN